MMTPLKELLIKDERENRLLNRPAELHGRLLRGLGLENHGTILAAIVNGWVEPTKAMKREIAEICNTSVEHLWAEK